MRYFNLLTSTAFIVCGILGIADASGKSDSVKRLEEDMPIYTAIYNYDKSQNSDINSFKQNLETFDINSLNKFPYKRSALHRAIEHMEPELVKWLLNKGAKSDYGLDTAGNVIQIADQPAHLVGHLEQYYNNTKDADAAKNILTELKKYVNISNWPAKTKEFIGLRNDWNNTLPADEKYDDLDFKVDDSSSASLVDDSKSSGSGSQIY